jgi:hypothetical protein
VTSHDKRRGPPAPKDKLRKMNGPPKGKPWTWLTSEMLVSEAWKALSANGLRALNRIMVEHMAHAGTENGQLIVTYDDFAGYGIRRPSIGSAIKELECLGWITVKRGRSYDGTKEPNLFYLTWLPNSVDRSLPTNRWKAIDSEHVEAYRERLKANKARRRVRKSERETDGHGGGNVVPLRAG